MDQAIFQMGLSVEGTSLYLMMVHLSDSGSPLVRENFLAMWNAKEHHLDQALRELLQRQVTGQEHSGRYFLRPTAEWLWT